ncbi:MAG: hypothetical protein WA294_10300 [Acidobacteriaceae bacterium]
MKIIILAPEHDNHTVPVKWALERAGYEVVCWAGLGWSPQQQGSIALPEPPRLRIGSTELAAGDAVWMRRPQPPTPNPAVAEADRKFAQSEYRWFSDSLLYLLDLLPVRCINRYSASRTIRNKAVQLVLAQRCGMSIPATLLSNAPETVRHFLHQPSAPSICKAFFPHIWRGRQDQSVAVTETFPVSEDMLPDDEVLTYAPAIYQQRIAKEFDVRFVLMGDAVCSVALHNPRGSIDWRQDVTQGQVRVESLATPEAIRQQVLAFARASGIVFGSFDFAVDRDGQWWFFEVNEQGQFLWLDDFNPDLHLMEKFLSFLTAPEGSTQDRIDAAAAQFPSWKDYLASPAASQPEPEQAPNLPECMSLE